MRHLEFETKFELTAGSFDRVKSMGRISRRDDQLNVYYDAAWRLADSSSTLRIRFHQRADPILALKIPIDFIGATRVMQEFEVILSRRNSVFARSRHPTVIDVQADLPRELGSRLLSLGLERVERIGWMRNTRLVIEIGDVGCIELDRLQLPDGTVVHEAEIETEKVSVQERLSALLCRHAPDALPSTMNKFQRFRRAAASSCHAVAV
ncbi:MAG TPA: CYTH domain-containing protein [Gemmatimonadaceae bacterium]|nr:CYTH domain-containing protein [Gemmatimonadaceae bacterium]